MPEREGPVEPKMRQVMSDIGHIIAGAIKQSGENYGFALLVFEYGDRPGARMNYASNAQRDDMLAAMKEFIARAEGRYHE